MRLSCILTCVCVILCVNVLPLINSLTFFTTKSTIFHKIYSIFPPINFEIFIWWYEMPYWSFFFSFQLKYYLTLKNHIFWFKIHSAINVFFKRIASLQGVYNTMVCPFKSQGIPCSIASVLALQSHVLSSSYTSRLWKLYGGKRVQLWCVQTSFFVGRRLPMLVFECLPTLRAQIFATRSVVAKAYSIGKCWSMHSNEVWMHNDGKFQFWVAPEMKSFNPFLSIISRIWIKNTYEIVKIYVF